MIFHQLLHIMPNCCTFKTSFKDEGIYVKIEPSDEVIFFFHIDDQSNKSSNFKEVFGLTGEICDLLIYYKKSGTNEVVLCLVECKPVKIDKAISQIENTYGALRKSLAGEPCTPIKFKAIIRIRRFSSPIEARDKKARLDKILGGTNRGYLLEKDDISIVLRNSSRARV